MAPPIITLLTDFGTADTYVAQVKGVILSINPAVTLVDLTHDVPPQSIATAAFLLSTAVPAFPRGTVHLTVVDPGVGAQRCPLLLVTPDALFVGPDNGVFNFVLEDNEALRRESHPPGVVYEAHLPQGVQAYQLTNECYWRRPVSSTFHARDIFGPVAAHLTLGVPPQELGESVESVQRLALRALRREGHRIEGEIIHVDRFGNLVTNIPGGKVAGRTVAISIARRRIQGLSSTYSAGEGLVALVGSHGLLEVAVRDGSAAALLGIGVGEPVRVEFVG